MGGGQSERRIIFHSSSSVCWQVHARIIKRLKNVWVGGCNDSLMTLTSNFSKGGSCLLLPGQLEECQHDILHYSQGHEWGKKRIIRTIKVLYVHPWLLPFNSLEPKNKDTSFAHMFRPVWKDKTSIFQTSNSQNLWIVNANVPQAVRKGSDKENWTFTTCTAPNQILRRLLLFVQNVSWLHPSLATHCCHRSKTHHQQPTDLK